MFFNVLMRLGCIVIGFGIGFSIGFDIEFGMGVYLFICFRNLFESRLDLFVEYMDELLKDSVGDKLLVMLRMLVGVFLYMYFGYGMLRCGLLVK